MKHAPAIILLVIGLLTMVGDLAGLDLLKGIGVATAASPAPKVFSAVRGYETYSTRFYLEWTNREGNKRTLAITPQLPAISVEQVAERKLRIPLLQDAGNAFARQLGLVWTLPDDLRKVYLGFGIDLAASNGDESWTLPMPARYGAAPASLKTNSERWEN